MLTAAKKLFSFIGIYLKTNLQAAMEYRGSFINQVLFMILNNAMLLFFWWILFDKIDAINGWNFTNVLLLYALASGSFACQALLFGGSFQISNMIANGHLDYYLALPKPTLLHVLISRSSASAWGDLIFSILVFWIAIDGDLSKLIWFPIFFFTGGLVMTSFAILAHSLSFWLGHSSGLASQLYEALLSFSLYPEGIFSASVRIILYGIIPAAFVSYIPVGIISGWQSYGIVIVPIYSLALALFARWVFYKGLKRYESGNLIVVQV
ncbi:MAG: hypothetical protein GX208_01635 [Firmicutes bacterium]|nr:hypothetical protein [Bacillota bacterium]